MEEERTIYQTFHPHLPVPLMVTEKSLLADASNPDREKLTIYDFDDPSEVSDTDVPNEAPTHLIYRIIEKGFTLDDTGTPVSYEYISRYAYNAQGQITATTNEKTSTRTFTAAGKIMSVTDRSGRGLNHTYTAQGLLEKSINTEGDYRFFAYDDHFNKIEASVYTAQGNQTFFTGHDFGDPAFNADLSPGKPWKTLARNPDNTDTLETVYAYTHGNITRITTPDTRETVFEYDTQNRIIQSTKITSDADQEITRYSYDTHGNLVKIIDALDHETTYLYDDLNRLVKIQSPDTGITLYTYDEDGRLTSITYPSGRTVFYEADKAGSTARVFTTRGLVSHILADTIAHQPFGPVHTLEYGNIKTRDIGFDLSYLIKDLAVTNIIDLSYTRNSAGNIKMVSDHLNPSNSRQYAYDSIYRLIETTGPYGEHTYTCDKTGNRLTADMNTITDTYTYLPGTNIIITATTIPPPADISRLIRLVWPGGSIRLFMSKTIRLIWLIRWD